MPTTEQIQNSKPSFESWCPPSESTGIPLHINELEPTMTQPEKIEIEGKEWNIWNLFKDESFTVVATELIHHVRDFFDEIQLAIVKFRHLVLDTFLRNQIVLVCSIKRSWHILGYSNRLSVANCWQVNR